MQGTDIATFIIYGIFTIFILFGFSIFYVFYVILTWENRIFKKQTSRIVKNANIWAKKPVYTTKIPCKSEKDFRLCSADKYLSDFFLTEEGEEAFQDAYNRNEDLKDYLYDFNHLSKNAVSKNVYLDCKDAVLDAIKYRTAFVITFEYKGQKERKTLSYKNIVQIRNRSFKYAQKQQIATETDVYSDYY